MVFTASTKAQILRKLQIWVRGMRQMATKSSDETHASLLTNEGSIDYSLLVLFLLL